MAKKMKGISLPIDMLVILAIAVVVLIAVIAVFMGVWSPFAGDQQKRAAFQSACGQWASQGCPDVTTAATEGVPNTVCAAAKGYVLGAEDGCTADSKNNIKRACGCAVI